MTILVHKRQIASYRYTVKIDGFTHDLSQEQFDELYDQIHKLKHPNSPQINHESCGDKMSHGPHAWGKNDLNYCTGRRFDST